MDMILSSSSCHIQAEISEAFEIIAGSLESGVIFICDHAFNAIPKDYHNLGLSEPNLQRHIAYDVGAYAVTRSLAQAFDAPAIVSRFSRLLIDPNRGIDDPTLVMRISDGALIPSNAYIGQDEVESRIERFYKPYHAAIKRVIDQAFDVGIVPVIISLHSFTRAMNGFERPWHVGVLWDSDPRLSVELLAALRAEPDIIVGDNLPYDGALMGDTLNVHATRRGLSNTLIEIRNDLICDEIDAKHWGERLVRILRQLLHGLELREIQFCESRTAIRVRKL
jgi:predicted N-formylglutamate amidohydrolase